MSVIGDEPLGVTEVSSIAADLSRSTDVTSHMQPETQQQSSHAQT